LYFDFAPPRGAQSKYAEMSKYLSDHRKLSTAFER
jgi:hypothetical protein